MKLIPYVCLIVISYSLISGEDESDSPRASLYPAQRIKRAKISHQENGRSISDFESSEEKSAEEKAKLAFLACNISSQYLVPPYNGIERSKFETESRLMPTKGDELVPGWQKEARLQCNNHLLTELANIVLHYCGYGFSAATAWSINLKKLSKTLNLSFEMPYGLVSCDDCNLWLTGVCEADSSKYTTFKISRVLDGSIEVTNWNQKDPYPTMDYGLYQNDMARCGDGMFVAPNGGTGHQLVSLKDGRLLVDCGAELKTIGSRVHRVWDLTQNWMIADFRVNNRRDAQKFIVNRATAARYAIEGSILEAPDTRILCHERTNEPLSLIAIPHDLLIRICDGMGKIVCELNNPGYFLYMGDDRSLYALRALDHDGAVYVCRYDISSGKCVSTVTLSQKNSRRCDLLANDLNKSRDGIILHHLVDNFVALHPALGESVTLPTPNSMEIEQHVSNASGNLFAAILSRKNAQTGSHLIVWNLAPKADQMQKTVQ